MGRRDQPWQDRDYVLKWFGKTAGPAKKAYREFVKKGILQGQRPELVGGGLIRSLGGWSVVKSLRRSGIQEKGDARILVTYGWDESIARALARTHEALNEMDHARRMYQEIMGHCSRCHSRIDPLVKEKYADLSFAAGIHDSAALELYLALAQEPPQKASTYDAKVSRIYQTLGNETEARRFLA